MNDELLKKLQEGRAAAQAHPKTPSKKLLLRRKLLQGPGEGRQLAEIRIADDGQTLAYKADLKACAAANPGWSKERVRRYVLENHYEYTGVQAERNRFHIKQSMELARKAVEVQRLRQKTWAQKNAEKKRAEREAAEAALKEREPVDEPEILPLTIAPETAPVDNTAFIAAFKSLPAEAAAERQLAWVKAHSCLALAGQWDDDNPMPPITAEDIADAPSRSSVTMLQYAMKHSEKFWGAIMSEDKKSGGKQGPAVDDFAEADDDEMEKLISSQDG